MSTLLHDLRYGLRMLAKNPGFATVATLTLALGIGATTAIFSVVNVVLLQPLPYADPSRLVLVIEQSKYQILSTSYQNYLDWRDQSRSFESLEAVRAAAMTLTGSGEPERVNAKMATAGLFPLLGVKPVAGRTFSPEEDRAGGAPVAVLSYELWQRRFGGAPSVIGARIDLDAEPYTVVGVLPPQFKVLQAADVFVPFMSWAKTLPDDRDWHPGIFPIARLKPGVTLQQARAEMQTIAARLAQQYPLYDAGKSADARSMQDLIVQNVRPALLLLMAAAGFVLLIACANIASLLLARAVSRRKEIVIRTALGATRRQIVRQLLTESALLGIMGGALGLLIAQWTIPPLLRLSAGSVPNLGQISVDGWVIAFTAATALLTSFLFGLAPAWQAASLDLRGPLNENSRGTSSGPAHHRLRATLVVAEIALAVLLTVGAGLLIRSLERMQADEPGFETTQLLVADLPLSPAAYAKPSQRFEFFDRFLDRTRTLPGVGSVGAASFLPVSGTGSVINFNIYGHPPKGPREFTAAGYRAVTPGYLETLAVRLLRGRFFTQADNETAPGAVIINAAMARTYFSGEDPLGKLMQLGALPDKDVPWLKVVGIISDVRTGLGADAQPEYYVPYRQADAVLPVFQLSVVLRTALDPMSQTNGLRSALKEVSANQPLVNPRTMEDNMAATVAQPRFRTWLLGIFSAVAVLLAALGIHGLVSYSVSQRTNEIGIRMALGAQPDQVLQAVIRGGLRMALTGIILDLGASLALNRVLKTFLYNVSAIDPITLAAVAALLGLTAALSSYVPARRATKVDPMVALRYE